jgi:hypothetical protein
MMIAEFNDVGQSAVAATGLWLLESSTVLSILIHILFSTSVFSSYEFFLSLVTNQKHTKSRVANFSLLHVWKMSSLLQPATPLVKKQKAKEPEVWTIKPSKSPTH